MKWVKTPGYTNFSCLMYFAYFYHISSKCAGKFNYLYCTGGNDYGFRLQEVI